MGQGQDTRTAGRRIEERLLFCLDILQVKCLSTTVYTPDPSSSLLCRHKEVIPE
jgi:hypothetical protein